MRYSTARREVLPAPTDPKFELPPPDEAEFLDLSAPEDEALLETGAWEDAPEDDEEDEPA